MSNNARQKLNSYLKRHKTELIKAWQEALETNNLLDTVRAKSDGQYYEANIIAPINAFLEALEKNDLSQAYRVIDTNIALRGLTHVEVSAIVRRLLLLKRIVREFIYRRITKMQRSNYFVLIGEIMDKYIYEIVSYYENIQKSQTEDLSHYYEGIIENTLAGILVADKTGVIQTVNQAMEKIMGLERAEIIGQILEESLSRYTDAELREAHLRALEGEATTFKEKKYKKYKGGTVYLDILVGPLCNPSGEICGTLHVAIDATKKVNLSQAAAESQRALEARLVDLQEAYGYIGKINRQLSSLIEIGDVMMTQKSLQETLNYIVRSAAMITKACGVALRLKSLQAGPEEVTAHYKDPHCWTYSKKPQALQRLHQQNDFGMSPQIDFIDPAQINVTKFEPSAERWLENIKRLKPPLQQIIVVPIAFQNECVGSLTLYFGEKREFTTLESNLLIAMANQAAVAHNVSTLNTLQNIS